jgi:predicted AAA+ superfamily ATPase
LATFKIFIISQNYVFSLVLAENKISMEKLIGREGEKKLLIEALQSSEAELITVYGRRRVGKTFLIRSVYENRLLFELSGVHNASLNQQLQNFSLALKKAINAAARSDVPANWIEAFYTLQESLAQKLQKEKSIIFFDEFPWIHTAKSGFLTAFEHFWNTWASRQKNLIVVICGSAASWMIQNIVNNKGGLHNRISQKIRLLPFNLRETEDYLKSRKVNLDRYQILQLYMAMGGIPQYLKAIKPGESAAQNIDRLCFTKDGILKGEFNNLYQSLFDNAESHIAVIKALASKGKGLTRTEIIDTCGLSSGGTATKLLEELVESGFISPYIPFDKKVKESIYKLSDEYSFFYLKFMEKTRSTGVGTWLRLANSSSWKSWSGFVFESICLKHISQIKKELGIGGVLTEESAWRYISDKLETGTQIDLLIDRSDYCINICEMKYSQSEFTIDKSYADELRRKQTVFRERLKTRKTLFLTMITTYGVKRNSYYTELIQNAITMDTLFD